MELVPSRPRYPHSTPRILHLSVSVLINTGTIHTLVYLKNSFFHTIFLYDPHRSAENKTLSNVVRTVITRVARSYMSSRNTVGGCIN